MSAIIGNETITIMADMAKCIQKAARESFQCYNFVFCFFHFKQNFLKNIKFTPSEDLWLLLQNYMKGEISEEFLRQKWWDEELNVDIELKGYNYLCKMAHFFAPNNTTHKRGIVSSQRIEMLNKVIKKNGNNAYDMLKQFFHISMKWFENSASILYPKNQLLTNYAEDVLHQIIQKEFLEKEFDELLHFKKNNCECSCFLDTILAFHVHLQFDYLESTNIVQALMQKKKMIF